MITAREISEELTFSAETGLFYWRASKGRKQTVVPAGKRDGQGYIVIGFRGRAYAGHRLAWLCAFGEWPKHDIDHINGDRADNRIANLRPCTNQQNQRNRRPNPKASNGGLKGAMRAQNGRWQARIKVNDKTIHLGTFTTVLEAHTAYVEAAERLFGEFARIA